MLNKIKLFAVCISALSVSFNALSEMEEVNIVVQGNGNSKELAIENALTKAISQVNGFDLNIQTQGDLLHNQKQAQDIIPDNLDMSTNITADEISSHNIEIIKKIEGSVDKYGVRKNFNYESSGIIKTWKVISESQSFSRDAWTIELEVVISRVKEFQLSEESNRKRIAVTEFRSNNQSFSNYIRDSLSLFLTQSRKFSVFDREFSAEQNQELSLYQTESFRDGEIARVGNRLGVDYIIVGKILELSEEQNTNLKLKTINTKFDNPKVKVKIDLSYKVLDVATSQLIYAGTIKKSFNKNKNTSDLDISRDIGSNIGNDILNAIYPIRIVDLTDDIATLAQGGNTLLVGEKYNLIQLGKKIQDPYTKENLGSIETNVGLVEIISIQNGISTAKIINSVKSDPDPASLILRPIKDNPPKEKENAKNRKPKLGKDISKDKDW